MTKIGILALQGDFREHERAFGAVGVKSGYVRRPAELEEVDGLVIPGGESTAIAKLMKKWGLFTPLQRKAREGFPVFGTCAGLILMAREVSDRVPTLGLMDISVDRNAYGRQIESFEGELSITGTNSLLTDEAVTGVFIRAPQVNEVRDGVEVLATHENLPVLLRQDNLLGASFHPELTDNRRIHRYFVEQLVDG